MRFCGTFTWLLAFALNGCENKKASPAPLPSSPAPQERSRECLSATERDTFSLQGAWWTAAGLSYCVGSSKPEHCLELQVLPNTFAPTTTAQVMTRRPRASEHPFKRTAWMVKSGVKVHDPKRTAQHDEYAIVESTEATDPASADSDESSEHVTTKRLLSADISPDRKHFAYANKGNVLVVQRLQPKGTDRFLVRPLHSFPLSTAVQRLWWLGDRVVYKTCKENACTLGMIDPLNPRAFPIPIDLEVAADAPCLHAFGESDFVAVSTTGEKVLFLDLKTGTSSTPLTLPRKSNEGVWSDKSGPFELAIVYGKPHLGDVVRVHLQQRALSTVNTASCTN